MKAFGIFVCGSTFVAEAYCAVEFRVLMMCGR